MGTLSKFLTVSGLFLAGPLVFASPSADEVKIHSILDNRNIDCSHYEPNFRPSLNFETLEPLAKLNLEKSQVSLYLPIVYYRCEKDFVGQGELVIVDPAQPYKYEVEQLDGTKTAIQVQKQGFVFRALPTGSEKKGFPARIERSGLIENVRFDVPLESLLTPQQRKALKQGQLTFAKLRILASLFMDYQIGEGTKDSTGLVPKFSATWTLKFSKQNEELRVHLQEANLNRL